MATELATTHFFDLPGEIRNTIYKYTFGDLAFHICSPDFIKDARRFTNTRWSTDLFLVNHQVHREALAAFSDNLTIYCSSDDTHHLVCNLPPFIRSNATRIVTCNNTVRNDAMTMNGSLENYKAWIPKLQRMNLLFTWPLRTYGDEFEIQTTDNLVSFLRGGLDPQFLSQIEVPVTKRPRWDPEYVANLLEDNETMMWTTEPSHRLRNVSLQYLYRIEFNTAVQGLLTAKINVSQSRSNVFGTWVSPEEVVLLIDEVSYPVVWSVPHAVGRVLVNDYALIQQVEEELEDPERLARALDKGFRCDRPLKRKTRSD